MWKKWKIERNSYVFSLSNHDHHCEQYQKRLQRRPFHCGSSPVKNLRGHHMFVPRPGSLSLLMLDVTEHKAAGGDVWSDEPRSPPCFRMPWPTGCPARNSVTWPWSGRWFEPTPTVLDPSCFSFLHLTLGASSVTSSLWFLLMLSIHSWRRTHSSSSWAPEHRWVCSFMCTADRFERWCFFCPLWNVSPGKPNVSLFFLADTKLVHSVSSYIEWYFISRRAWLFQWNRNCLLNCQWSSIVFVPPDRGQHWG